MKRKAPQNAHRGSDFRDFLAGEGILPEVEVLALKRGVFLRLQQMLEHEHVTNTELASRMKRTRRGAKFLHAKVVDAAGEYGATPNGTWLSRF